MSGETQNSEWYKSNVVMARELGLFALRTLFTLNAGACIVLLTFVGNASVSSVAVIPVEALKVAMTCFLMGIAFAAVLVTIAYVQSLRLNAAAADLSELRSRLILYCGLGLASLALFIVGVAFILGSAQAP